MGDLALQIEQLIRRLAARKIKELLEEKFADTLLEEMQAATASFLQSNMYREMVSADLKGLLISGLVETTVKGLVRSEIQQLISDLLQQTVMEVVGSPEIQAEIKNRVALALQECLRADEFRSKVLSYAREAINGRLRDF